MRAIVRNFAIVAAASAAFAFADPRAEIVDRLASMTSALANDNAAGFMAPFDKNMPGYDTLRDYIGGMIEEAEVSSVVDPIKDDGNDTKRSVDLDWTLHFKSRQAAGPIVDREKTIHAEFVKEKAHWKIVSIAPLDFFAPARFSQSK
jgi:hypothetical protein